MPGIRAALANDYRAAFPSAAPLSDSLAQLDALYPFLADLRTAAARRPFFRLIGEYVAPASFSRPLAPITTGIALSRLVTLHALLALDQRENGVALEDINLNQVLLSGLQRDPTLVGGLVAIGMLVINNTAVYSGLATHAWTDEQLMALERMLGSVDFLAIYQFDMRAEIGNTAANFDHFSKSPATHMLSQLSNRDLPILVRFAPPWPTGWWNDNKSELAAFLFSELAVADPKTQRVFPKVALRLSSKLDQAVTRWDARAPWNVLYTVAAPPLANASEHFAEGQVWVDETRIACVLERYRLVHHAYPGALAALIPADIETLPHDIMNGQLYRYRLRPEGTFLLYSVGWDQRDDGGKLALKADGSIDYEQGDWVWPTPK